MALAENSKAEKAEVIKIRIDSLQHNRQFIAFLAGGFTGIYTIIGIFLVNKGFSCDLFTLVLLLLTFALADLCFILSVFLLTDSIHNYSKILEYDQLTGSANEKNKSRVAHLRALTSDDLSYFFVRVGTYFLTYNLLLAILTDSIHNIKSIPFFIAPGVAIIFLLIVFYLVIYCYRVSHYKVPEDSFFKAIAKFWNPRRWRKAANSFTDKSMDEKRSTK